VSRGLGPQQIAAMLLLSDRNSLGGLTVADLGEALGLSPRRTRAVVQSLIRRGRVAARYDRGRLRVWHPVALERFEFEEACRADLLSRSALAECPRCGASLAPKDLQL
jgi:DNA-binding IclR family transcriptional regulator